MNNILMVVSVFLILMMSCTEVQTPKFSEDFQKTNVELKINVYNNKNELRKVVGRKSGQAVWSPNDNKCEVHFVKWDFETAGHELHHCMYGSFHEEPK